MHEPREYPHVSAASPGEPIAIIGLSCRLPGSDGPEAYWELLSQGREAIREVPADRWSLSGYWDPQNTPGKTYARLGGFLDRLEEFDPSFFGISPREAARMDPQQRLLLEVAWESLEDAGQVADQLAGSDTGVFVGLSSTEYCTIQTGFRDLTTIDTHTGTGAAMSIAANRISYCFDLKGPSIALDTACSSSLVAMHIACETLWHGGCSMAIAGGVNTILKPDTYVIFASASMLSPDGRCKAFDESADGFVRGEGAGIVVLKPLRRALADGDRVRAVIRATSANQDGRSNGLTVPDQKAQEEMLTMACQRAGLRPHDLDYIEAHGTGTSVGDPIEGLAIGHALGKGRPKDEPCLLGSSKTNIGHLEPAAGIAGVIKTVMAMERGQIPPSLHFHNPNPKIPFDELGLRVVTELQPWPDRGHPPRAGVNSFGFGGANAHVILEAAPKAEAPERHPLTEERPELFPLAARSPEALKALAGAYAEHLDGLEPRGGWTFRDTCWSAALRRSHHNHRLAAVARNADELAELLRAFAHGETRSDVLTGNGTTAAPSARIAFALSGQGPQWWGMGRQLLEEQPVFRQVVERADAVIRELGDWSLLEELSRDETSSRLNRTSIAQPAIFALQVGLAELWRSWGIEPSVLVGHSVGEIGAAHLCGALDFESATRVIFHRGRTMDLASSHGRMLAVGQPEQQVREFLAGREHEISVAAINSAGQVTLSGEGRALEEVAALLEKRDVFHKFLRVEYAFHSPLMDPIRDELLSALADIEPGPASRPMYSSVTGTIVRGPELDAEYWWRNVRQTVRFAGAADAILDEGVDAFVELSPHPVLAGYLGEAVKRHDSRAAVVHSLRRKEDERTTLLKAAGGLYAIGAALEWRRIAPEGGRLVPLPSYTWQRQPYWSEAEDSRISRLAEEPHPLLGIRVRAATPTWEKRLQGSPASYLEDHRVQGQAIVPGTAYLELALAAAQDVLSEGRPILENVELQKPCFLTSNPPPMLQTIVDPSESTFRIVSRPAGSHDGIWTQHVRGRVVPAAPANGERTVRAPMELARRLDSEMSSDECYRLLSEIGLEYGPGFQGIERLWRGRGEALGLIRPAEEVRDAVGHYTAHPGLLDACLQTLICALDEVHNGAATRRLYLPVEFRSVQVHEPITDRIWSHARVTSCTSRELVANIDVLDKDGRIVAEIRGLCCQAVEDARGESLDDLVYEYVWDARSLPASEAPDSTPELLPSPSEIAAATAEEAHRLDSSLSLLETNRRLQSVLDPIAMAYVRNAFAKLGQPLVPGTRFTASSLIDGLGVASAHHRLFHRYLRLLVEDRTLRETPSGFEVLDPHEGEDADEMWRDSMATYPGHRPELTLVGRCGRELAEVLRGEVDPLGLIFPEGSLGITEQLYQDSLILRQDNLMAQRAASRIFMDFPPGQPLRVLEIGAGTGGMTTHILPHLPSKGVEYVFSDLSPHFFSKAQEKLRDHSFIEYKRLNIEEDPLEQGFEAGSFDLVVASHALHATVDLRAALGHTAKLLKPGGLVLLGESIRPMRWFDVVFGLTEGWWRFEDTDLRREHPMLPLDRWLELLAECGFDDPCEASGELARESNTAIVLARKPRERSAEHTALRAGAQSAEAGTWVVLADQRGVANRLIDSLSERGQTCIEIRPGSHFHRLGPNTWEVDPTDPEDMNSLVREVVRGLAPACQGVLHLWNLDADGWDTEDPSAQDVDATLTRGNLSLVHLVQALLDAEVEHPPRVWVVTERAESVTAADGPTQPLQAAVWGLNRVIMNELPRLRPTTVDLGSCDSQRDMKALCDELLANDAEDEIALRGGRRLIHRFVRKQDGDRSRWRRAIVREDVEPFRLESSRVGMIDHLLLRSCRQKPLGPDDVEIRVAAAGLNFSDVMKSLGIYPGLPDGPVPFGIECSGVVSRVGDNVSQLRAGQRVVAIAPFSFGSHVVTPAGLAAPIPEGMSYEAAATIPIAFITAYYALHHLGRLRAGERVLVHAAAGGVGLAAIQLAQRAGAEIFATAGTDEKRELLRSLGVPHVLNSRTLEFAEEILEITGGEGVDLVLNSLAGDAIRKGLEILRDFGRFLEIGKRDIYADTKIGLKPFRNNVSLMAIDLDRAMRLHPGLVAELYQKMMVEFHEGRLAPLIFRTFPLTNLTGAFRHMAQAKHIGKVVVSLREQEVRVAPEARAEISFPAEASYLITGGLGGFGLTVGQWLVRHGARHVALVGRRGAATPEAEEAVQKMREGGAQVVVFRADVSREEALQRVLEEMKDTMPPVRGVFHAAMVLRDALVVNMDEAKMRDVWAAKVQGAINLHRLTSELPLDHFVLFSSMSATFGAGGQSNYAAANSMLDSLATHRRAQGLPALSVAWGALGQVGFVAEHADIAERFENAGFEGFEPAQALTLLGRFMQREQPNVAVMRVNWPRYGEHASTSRLSPRFQRLVRERLDSVTVSDERITESAHEKLRSAPSSSRRELLVSLVRAEVARVLGASESEVDPNRPLNELGLDSLMAVELQNWIESDLRLQLPTMALMKGPSVAKLSESLAKQLKKLDAAASREDGGTESVATA